MDLLSVGVLGGGRVGDGSPPELVDDVVGGGGGVELDGCQVFVDVGTEDPDHPFLVVGLERK